MINKPELKKEFRELMAKSTLMALKAEELIVESEKLKSRALNIYTQFNTYKERKECSEINSQFGSMV